MFRRNKEEEDRDNKDNGNVERSKGCLAVNVCANQRGNGHLLSGLLVLFSVDNSKDNDSDNKGANKEAYHIAKNLLYRINNDKDLMGPREKSQLVWSKRYASTISSDLIIMYCL